MIVFLIREDDGYSYTVDSLTKEHYDQCKKDIISVYRIEKYIEILCIDVWLKVEHL